MIVNLYLCLCERARHKSIFYHQILNSTENKIQFITQYQIIVWKYKLLNNQPVYFNKRKRQNIYLSSYLSNLFISHSLSIFFLSLSLFPPFLYLFLLYLLSIYFIFSLILFIYDHFCFTSLWTRREARLWWFHKVMLCK